MGVILFLYLVWFNSFSFGQNILWVRILNVVKLWNTNQISSCPEEKMFFEYFQKIINFQKVEWTDELLKTRKLLIRKIACHYTFLMSSKVWISGERPPCTQRNCWFINAAKGKQSKASMQASYTRSVYLILPWKCKEKFQIKTRL